MEFGLFSRHIFPAIDGGVKFTFRTIILYISLPLIVALGACTNASAEPEHLWEIGIGGAVGSFPAYRGAKAQHTYFLPVPFVTYRGDWISFDREGLRGKLFESERWRLELSADAMVPVERDDGMREGMPELAPMLELGPSLEYLIEDSGATQWRLRLPLRSTLSVDLPSIAPEGLMFHPNLAVDHRHGGWEFGGSFGPLFASDGYHDYYYGVSSAYETPDRPRYEAEAGYSGTRLTLGASRYFKDYWFGMFIRYDDLSGASFTDSPLVEKESAVMGGMALTWLFQRSETMVER